MKDGIRGVGSIFSLVVICVPLYIDTEALLLQRLIFSASSEYSFGYVEPFITRQ